MRVLIDGSTLVAEKAGIGNYTYALLEELPLIDSAVRYDVLVPMRARALVAKLPGVAKQVSAKKSSLRFLPWDWEKINGKYDIYHEPNYIPRIFSGKVVSTVHDMSVVLYPRYHPLRRTLSFHCFKKRIKRCIKIITVSQSSKNEIVDILKVPEENVAVTYLGAGDVYRPLQLTGEQRIYIKKCYGLPENFILYVGTIEPRKNLVRLLEAFNLFKKEMPGTGIKLVIAGGRGWFWKEVFHRAEQLKLGSDVIFTGYISREHLPFIYNSALAFVYPSIYEGFGLPPLEAMSCGLPVISSNTSSIPEVVGDAGLLVDPSDVNKLAEAMLKVLQSASLREEMSRRGLARAALFSWEKCARETLSVYKECMELK